MRITIFHTLHGINTGDGVILQGTEKILTEAYGNDIEFVYQDFGPGFKADVMNFESDLLIIPGTPWFYDLCAFSAKYDLLKRVVKVHEKSKKVALGLGSCYPMNTNLVSTFIERKGDTSNTRKEFVEEVSKIFKQFDFVFTRDPIANYILNSIDIKSEEVLCPAVFDCKKEPVPVDATPLLIFVNPFDFVSSSVIDEIFGNWLVDFQMDIIKTYNPKIITCTHSDMEFLKKKGVKSEWVLTADKLVKIVSAHNPIYSGRVHAAIPARVMGRTTYIFVVDTRYLAVSKMGAVPIYPFGNYNFTDLTISVNDDYSNLQERISRTRTKLLESLKSLKF